MSKNNHLTRAGSQSLTEQRGREGKEVKSISLQVSPEKASFRERMG